MIICLAALESEHTNFPEKILKYGLVSYYYVKDTKTLNEILKKVDYLLIDSGAHSFQHGIKVDIDKFCDEYLEFIKENTNNPRIMGFFELDVDNVYGYEKILQLRRRLETVSDKIIPVWHNNRGIDNFVEMCKEYSGRRVSITGWSNNDIKDSQYNLFINTAHKYGCQIHLLGLTRLDLIDNLNLGLMDSTDSSSWIQTGIFGKVKLPLGNRKMYNFDALEGCRCHHRILKVFNFLAFKEIQEEYLNIDNSVFAKTTQK